MHCAALVYGWEKCCTERWHGEEKVHTAFILTLTMSQLPWVSPCLITCKMWRRIFRFWAWFGPALTLVNVLFNPPAPQSTQTSRWTMLLVLLLLVRACTLVKKTSTSQVLLFAELEWFICAAYSLASSLVAYVTFTTAVSVSVFTVKQDRERKKEKHQK